MSLQIYNTLTKQKESFVPLNPPHVSIYICGPTVYDLLHIGNFRGPIFFNLVRNWMEESGYKVKFVQNYTDVDDKIINRANQEKTTSEAVAEKYIQEYKKDYDGLGLRAHDHNPKVTEHMDDIIAVIQKIIESGHAYVAPDGEVLYSVRSFEGYGKLSHKNIEELQSGIRVEVSDKKKDPLDFTLWKPSKPGEPTWDSPWGKGRPGWHIECSAMVSSIFGKSIDIHGGGIDLIFPHHENEVAQSEGAYKQNYVKYWVHWNFINFGAHKMSKSLGNIKTGRSFIEQYNPEILKYMILRAHYRSLVDFSEEQIQDAIHGLARFYSAMCTATSIVSQKTGSVEVMPEFKALTDKTVSDISAALNDDFNTPKMFAALFEVVRFFNGKYKRGQKITPQIMYMAEEFLKLMKSRGQLMSLFQHDPDSFLKSLDDMLLNKKNIKREDIDAIVNKRIEARAQKDFKTSDSLRDQLVAMGISIQDTPQGTYWEVSK